MSRADDGRGLPPEPVRDVAQLGHLELFTPRPERTLWFFTDLMGMHETHREGQSVYLRGYGEFEAATLKLTERREAGVGHIAWRTWSPQALTRRVEALRSTGLGQGWIDGDFGHGPAYRFTDPEGHPMEIYWEVEKRLARPEARPKFKNQSERSPHHGVGIRRIDHLHLLCQDVTQNRSWMGDQLGFFLREHVVIDDGTEISAWISVTPIVHEIAYSIDATRARARLHHAGFAVDNREDVLRAADIMVDNGIFIESGPSKHKLTHQFFLYVYEPGGNRVEVVTTGYLIFAPDWEPVRWSQAERAEGQAWGLKLPRSFHSYGTPVVEVPEEQLREVPVVAPW
jgi:catechol 2,3-dioxygenase